MSAGMTWSKRPARWLLYTGIFELVLAGVFVALAISIPAAAAGMYVTAGVLGLTGVGLLVWGRAATRAYDHAQQLRTTGVATQASIVSMRQTGVQMNDQPQIELELRYDVPGEGTHTATRKEYVPLMLLGVLTSGIPLPIRVDPQNPTDIAIEWELAGAAGAAVRPGAAPAGTPAAAAGGPTVTLGAGAGPGGIPDAAQIQHARARFRATGVDGTATLESAQVTALEVADNKVFQVTMTVQLPGRDPYQVAHMALIPERHAPAMVAGATLPVKVDRDDPSTVMLDWDRA
jgi:hypothetical protein